MPSSSATTTTTTTSSTLTKSQSVTTSKQRNALLRPISKSLPVIRQSEGQGAVVYRVIGNRQLDVLDPFLLLDEFHIQKPHGFPNHPHRGFETVTYMLQGAVQHKDNHGGGGTIHPGDIQWMTAGSGLIHSEMPVADGDNFGLQLWVNLPKKHKMAKPRYQSVLAKHQPTKTTKDGVTIKLVAGKSNGLSASIALYTPVLYVDVTMTQANSKFTQEIPSDYQGFVYIFKGNSAVFNKNFKAKEKTMLVIDELNSNDTEQLPDHITVENTKAETVRFFIICGKPIKEPVARYGPFVMNTQQEIQEAFDDYRNGKFQ